MREKRIGMLIAIAVLLILLIWTLFPIYWMVNTSFKPDAEIYNIIPTLWPKQFTTINYEKLISSNFFTYVGNSLTVAGTVTVFGVFLSTIAAYAISKLRFRGRTVISQAIIYAYLIPRSIMYIPLYMLVSRLNLLNSLWALMLIYPTLVIPYATWILIAYFKTIPNNLEEAALIDGCTRLQTLFLVAIPLAAPGIMSTAIFSFTMCWGDHLYALVIITKDSFKTIPLGISDLIVDDLFAWGQLAGAAIFAALPVLLLYMLGSKYIVTGVTAGAVKG
ncbi:MAG: carbohydrate ABC transporter permease [Clostridiales bacterium]|nr:carbohydrate ABC transporter permease [Clostridiales bacterium]